MHLPEGAESFSDVPRDYNLPPLGTRDELIARFWEHFGNVDITSEPGWIKFGADVFPFSRDVFNVLTIRNPSEELLDYIVQYTDWKILDAGTGERVRWLEKEVDEADDI